MGCTTAKGKGPTQAAPIKKPPPEPLPANQADINATYNIGKVINHGKFGVVREGYLKSDTTHRVAVKSIDKTSSSTNPQHLRREIENLEQVNHPNVMKLYNVYMDDQYIHLVTELCTGGELFDRILEKGRFDEVEAALVMRQILEAVKHLHSLKIVHRDLKPENFMFLNQSPDSPIKLIDFGFSKRMDTENQQMQTMVGTPSYVSPELLTGTYGQESDLWSCGVILYTILSGRYPFYDEDEQTIYKLVKQGALHLDDTTWSNISPEAKDLVTRLLEKDPTKRYTAVQALAHPWFTKTEGPAINVDQKAVEAYKLLKVNSKLQQETMLFLVHNFNLDEIRNFREIFQDADVQNSNELTPAEVKRCIMTRTAREAVPELEALFSNVEGSEEGKIKYMNLLEASKACKSKMYEETVWATFKTIDVANSGLVPATELKRGLREIKKVMPEAEFQARLTQFAIKPEGKVDFEEFKRFLLQD